MNLKSKKPTLLLVDVQKAFLDKDYPGLKEIMLMQNSYVEKYF
jgi:hypothetical protein